jgi:GTPase SAR1 family protein
MDIKKKQAIAEFNKIAEQFLKPQKKTLKPSKLLKSRFEIFKDFQEECQSILESHYSIKKIDDLALWVADKQPNQIAEVAKELPIDNKTWENWVILASLAHNLDSMKRSDTMRRKLIIAGLDNAGKTSILNYYLHQMNTSSASKTKPTLGAENSIVKIHGETLNIQELGGQTKFRELYLKNPENYFMYVNYMIFVFDIQDAARLTQACLYLVQILDILSRLKVDCTTHIFFHKCDPDYLKKPEVIENFLQIDASCMEKLTKYDFRYSSAITSIYAPLIEYKTLFLPIYELKDLAANDYNQYVKTDAIIRYYKILNSAASQDVIYQKDFKKIQGVVEGFIKNWQKP